MLRALFLHDLPTKLMALGLGVVVWVFLDQLDREASQEVTVTEDLRLTVVPPPRVAVLGVTAPEDPKRERLDGPNGQPIRVTLRGLKGVLGTAVRGLECRHRLDPIENLSDRETLAIRRKLRDSDFDLPRGIKVMDIAPTDIQVEVAQETVRVLRISDNAQDCLRGAPPEGLQIERTSFSPTHVRVRGLRHILDRLNTIPIVPVDLKDLVPADLGNRSGAFSQHVQIQDTLQGTRVTTDEAVVMTVTLRPMDIVRSLADVRVELLFPDAYPHSRDRVRILGAGTVTAHLRGPARAVEGLMASRQVRVLADVGRAEAAAPPRWTCPLRALVDVPEGSPPVQVTLEPALAALEVSP